jgi:hypothetical protein
VYTGGVGGGYTPPRSNFGGGTTPPSFSINSLAKQTALKLNPIQDTRFESYVSHKVDEEGEGDVSGSDGNIPISILKYFFKFLSLSLSFNYNSIL